ncbi:MAG: 2-C-methyl-D-erythritol 2,4-cyclodiphosphate synthase [Armatimonadetes bacterium]|nr:2-C-methyl-D-erythritol 2,4-cyclodiphosphate synthase [Armatimonadota bacterium]
MGAVAAVIVAAGRGTRFGGALPKVFAPLGGVPLLRWSAQAYDECPQVESLVVVAPADHLDLAREVCAGIPALRDVVPGGEQRPDSVLAGLQALAEYAPDIVCVHDGARPLVDRGTIERSIAACREHGAAVAGIPATDTLKQVDTSERIVATPVRSRLRHAQTPQTFRYELLLSAYEQARREGLNVTDDASLVERMSHPVVVSEGHPDNIKITTPDDLARAEWLLARREGRNAGAMRVGVGLDVHALVEGRPLILGGVSIPFERGLAGHSDADVLLHAISDALLGAAALGDIGLHFPDTDPQYSGADSADLLRRVVALLAQKGWRAVNVDATVICERPKLAPHIPAMRANIAAAVGLPVEMVGVKATTTEGLGFAGRGEGIAAQAVVLIEPRAEWQ